MKKSYQQAKSRSSGTLRYKHDLGQNFIYDEALLENLVQTTGVSKQDTVLEIGAGAGTLTKCLSRAAGRVVAVEVDEAVFPLLTVATQGLDNVSLMKADIRKLDSAALSKELGEGFYVIANIPYNITTPILNLFLGGEYHPRQLSLMVQKEVAQKLLCTPGGAEYGLISFICQYYCEGEIASIIPAACFTPPPKVDSAFINLRFRPCPILPVTDEKLLFRLVKAAFQLRRKTLINALGGAITMPPEQLKQALTSLSLSPTVRGEALSIEQWISLSNFIAQSMS